MMRLSSIIVLLRWLYLNERISQNNHLIGKLSKTITSYDSIQSPNKRHPNPKDNSLIRKGAPFYVCSIAFLSRSFC